jgi:hypothetical protein
MQPLVEGIRVVYRQIPSPRDDSPFAIEATVQVQASISPFGIGFRTDAPITGGKFDIPGASLITGEFDGHLAAFPKNSFYVKFDFPPITPQRPLRVILFAKERFNVVQVFKVE